MLFTLNYAPKKYLPISEYLQMQERFSGMRELAEMVEKTQEIIEARWSFWNPVLAANQTNGEERIHDA